MIAGCQIISVIVINILRKSAPTGAVGVLGTFCPSRTHYKHFRMPHFSMSNIYFSIQIMYFTRSLPNTKLMLKAILDF